MKYVPIVFLCSAAAMIFAAPAMAASSDYLLVIDGVNGEASVATRAASWSFGASHPATSSVSGNSAPISNIGSSGQDGVSLRESPTKASLGKTAAARDAQSGMASGKRSASGGGSSDCNDGACVVGGASSAGDERADLALLERLPEISNFAFNIPEGSEAAARFCTGKHIAHAHIVRADGQVHDLSDLAIASCASGGDGALRVTVRDGKITNKTGHVTLMK